MKLTQWDEKSKKVYAATSTSHLYLNGGTYLSPSVKYERSSSLLTLLKDLMSLSLNTRVLAGFLLLWLVLFAFFPVLFGL